MPKPAPRPNRRFIFLGLIFTILSVVLLGRLFVVQVIEHELYAARAEDQYGMVKTVPAVRGTIRTSDGFDLATTQPAYLIAVDASQLTNPAETARALVTAMRPSPTPTPLPTITPTATVTPVAPTPTPLSLDDQIADMTEKLSDRRLLWVPVGRKVDEHRTDAVRQLDLKGVYIYPDQQRYYPEGTLASQVLGFVGQDNDGNDKGYYGIEGYFDRDLRGRDGKIALEKDTQGNPIPVGKYQPKPVENGSTITLTINRSMQYLLEQKLKAGVERMGAELGSVIVMEPSTGRILTMANFPTYDPSEWALPQVQQDQLFRNSAIADAYEPGSVVKSFTAAAGLELGVFDTETTFDSAPFRVGDHTITTANHKYYGPSTLTQMLQHSDNTVAAQFGLKIGRDKFIAMLQKIGLNRPTGITLEGEGQSIIPDPSDWLPVTVATAAFGQGISVTPLQLLQMMATIANDGVQMKPTILSSVTKGGQTQVVEPETVGRVFSSQTSQKMATMLEDVVERGEFRRLALQGYHIAGKTSTAQIPTRGGYDQHKVITTFVGYVPAKNPKFIMLVKLNRPKINNSAETVVPVWMDMAMDLFRHYGMAPDPVVNQ